MIKVLHITFDLKLGGTQQVIRQLVTNVDAEKVESHIICIDGIVGELGEVIEATGKVKVTAVQRRPGIDLKLVKTLAHYVKQNNIDVVHCHQYSPYFYGALATLGRRAKLIFTEHGRFYPDIVSTKRQWINRILAMWTSSITAISKATVQALIDLEKLPQKKMDVIYNGINPELTKSSEDLQKIAEFREQYHVSENDFVFGTISRLEPIKNQKMMINAFKSVLEFIPNAKLLLIGDGAARQDLEAQADELGLREKVVFSGFIVDPQNLLQIMDVFLLPSFSEGTSMTLLEAMSYSKPAIVTNVGGSPEIVLQGETGIVVESDNTQELIDAMLKLNSDSELRKEYGENAYKRFCDHFTDTVMVEKYQSLYRRLVGSVSE